MAFKDIRKSRKWLSVEEIRLLALLLFIFVVVLAGNIAMARVLPGGEWFFLRWSGARAFLIEQIDASRGVKGGRMMPDGPALLLVQQVRPYGSEIARRTQQVAYARLAFADEYAYVLNDPFYIVLLYTPFAFFRDFALARGIWMLLSEAALIGTTLLALNLSEWQPPRWLYILLLGYGLFHYFSFNALFTSTPAVFLVFLYLWILVGLRSHSDELAGALLALAAYQWEVGGLFVLFILMYVFANRRWGVLAGFGMVLFVLLVISFLSDSGWGLPYIRAVLSDWYRGANLSFGHIFAKWFPNLRIPVGRIVSIGLGIVLFIEWVGSFDSHFRRVVWTAALSLSATPLMGMAMFPSNYVVLILPFILVLAMVWERWRRYQVIRNLLVFLLVLLIPFALYIRTVLVYDPLMTDILAVLPPIAAIAGLYWMRWWVLHAPLTWSDQLGVRR
jgi:glycosyl transferase family 87